MVIRRLTWFVVALSTATLFAACKKDASLKASKSECEDACTHATSLNTGNENLFTKRCPLICVEKEWTVGDTRCLDESKTFPDVQNCGAVAKALLDIREAHAGRRSQQPQRRRHIQRGQPQSQPGQQPGQPAQPAKGPGDKADDKDDTDE